MTHRKTNAGEAISGARRHFVLVGLTSTLPHINRRYAPRQERSASLSQRGIAPRIVMLLRLLFLESEGRSDVLDDGRLARVYLFRERIQAHRDGWEGPRSSNPMALAWFVWERDHRGNIELRRISRQGDEAPAHPLDIPPCLRRAAP